jgi:glutamine phosphoribosylpyrophosphate amidotransferase
LESEGAIFSSTSDTEVILHGVARSRAASVAEAIPEFCARRKARSRCCFSRRPS